MNRYLYLVIFTIILTACMPQQAIRQPVSVENNDVSNSTDTDTSSSEITQNAQWYDSGSLVDVLTVDETNTKNIYLYGDDINLYLTTTENYQATYCAFIDFQATLDKTPKQYRVRLIPQVSYNGQTGKSSRFFRVNANIESGNELCNYDSFEENIVTADIYNAANVTNTIDQICTNCLNMITSNSLVIYKKSANNIVGPDSIVYPNGYFSQVPLTAINYSSLVLRVDLNNNSSNNSPSCSNSTCQAQGFDCCVQGQCVNDAGLKNTRAEVQQISININDPSYLTQFDYAESQKITNPLIYLQYPQYYYICLEDVPNDTTTTDPNDPTDPVGDAKVRLRELITDYYCIEELKTNSTSDPFHTDPYNLSATYKVCHGSDDPNADPDMYYQDVMMRMYSNCGCAATTYNEMVANCPKYTYRPTYNTRTTDYTLTDLYNLMVSLNKTTPLDIEELATYTDITKIECLSPEVDPNITPFSNMSISVNSKTAPHRFFDKNTDSNNKSIEITDVNNLPTGASGTQEGDPFQYLDDQKVFPLNGSFNMNSLLGQMTLDLSLARPAVMINLEYDKQYYIATLEGYYSPCPSCAKDYWFPNFSPNPNSSQGIGLQSIGYTTRRDAWGSNTTFGNYEDTIFGRACWVPPTMIPFSHDENSDQQTQRLNRLKTQAAYYMNGYQRDWFGFNKGALIGSFDGVSWFAIGKGRIAKSTSDRLYLAINAPFADLALYNDHIVSVQEWDFITTGPKVDYDPNQDINSTFQNEAGLCQRNHQCEVDSDCVTKLGWEYSCVDVTQYTTKWPQFEVDGAKEIAGASQEGTIISFLNQGELPTGSTKRCVYRGAGAPCRVNYDQITDSGKRKALACAPNFYCAKLSNGSVFNSEVARYASILEDISESKNHYFGMDANQLGRPKDYISTGNLSALPADTQTAIANNLSTIDSSATSDFGICRPGKSLPEYAGTTSTSNSDFIEQQKTADTSFRTDYISQISGCNSALFTNLRFSSCPMLDDEGNYLHLKDDFVADALLIDSVLPEGTYWSRIGAEQIYGHSQNSCGLEVLSSSTTYGVGVSADTLSASSAFSSIEGKPLSSSDVHYEPTLTRDACFRKAGAVCHTDLDCSPNYKHADLIDILNPSLFGNEAEKKYWQEYLVCGQGTKEPLLASDPNFNTYDMTNNRCCREIGKDISMYTEDSPIAPESAGLRTDKFGNYFPNDNSRYSRYNNLNTHFINESTLLPDGSFRRPSSNTNKDGSGNLTNIVNILNGKQWKTFNSSAKRTCCGGGWIRKFADGTNNWTVNRLHLDVTNFRCLNFDSPLVDSSDPAPFGLSNTVNNQDSQNFCLDATSSQANCSQLEFLAIDWTQTKPYPNTADQQMTLLTIPDDMNSTWPDNRWAYYPLSIADSGDPALTWLDWSSEDPNKDPDTGAKRRHLAFKIPSFITWPQNQTFDSSVKVELELPTSTPNDFQQCTPVAAPSSYDCGDANAWHGLCTPRDPQTTGTRPWETVCPDDGTHKNCCYVYNPDTRVLKVAHNMTIIDNTGPWLDGTDHFNFKDLGMRVTFTSPGTLLWEQNNVGASAVSDYSSTDSSGFEVINHRRSARPGNAYYYLRKLEKLELLGIPQITYEPLYCHDNYQKIVPGLFKSEVNGNPLTNIIEFNNHPDTFLSSSDAKPYRSDSASSPYNMDGINEARVADQTLVDHEPVFSDHDFMCCYPLGTQIDSSELSNCCSGYASGDDSSSSSSSTNTTVTCKLPPGTDVNIYLNKFVSGEGLSEDLDLPLTEEDFDDETGYPLFNQTVFQKVKSFATSFCEGGAYVQGGAFGPFVAEPHGSLGKYGGADANRLYSIVDSAYDSGSNNNRPAGFDIFNAGQRWNHHIYCDPTGGSN